MIPVLIDFDAQRITAGDEEIERHGRQFSGTLGRCDQWPRGSPSVGHDVGNGRRKAGHGLILEVDGWRALDQGSIQTVVGTFPIDERDGLVQI